MRHHHRRALHLSDQQRSPDRLAPAAPGSEYPPVEVVETEHGNEARESLALIVPW